MDYFIITLKKCVIHTCQSIFFSLLAVLFFQGLPGSPGPKGSSGPKVIFFILSLYFFKLFCCPPLIFTLRTVTIAMPLSSQGDAGQPGLPGTMGSAGKTVRTVWAMCFAPRGSRLFWCVSFPSPHRVNAVNRVKSALLDLLVNQWVPLNFISSLFVQLCCFIVSKYLLFLFSGRHRTARLSGSCWQARCQGRMECWAPHMSSKAAFNDNIFNRIKNPLETAQKERRRNVILILWMTPFLRPSVLWSSVFVSEAGSHMRSIFTVRGDLEAARWMSSLFSWHSFQTVVRWSKREWHKKKNPV